MSCSKKKEEGKELTPANLSESLLDPDIKRDLEQLADCLTTIGAIRAKEGCDASFRSVLDFTLSGVRDQLVGPGVDDDLTEEEIEELAQKNFALEVARIMSQ